MNIFNSPTEKALGTRDTQTNAKNALINPSPRRKPGSRLLNSLDSGLRGYDDNAFFQRFPKWLRYIVLLAIYFLAVSFGFGPYITDDHAFRQTQTAITTYYFSSFRDFLYYITPLLGPPWSLPFEFPLYQPIVKLTHAISGLSLETSGRVISIIFFLLCFWPINRLLNLANVQRKEIVVSLCILTPLYVFWSRSFMIETTALFFSLLYGSICIHVFTSPSVRSFDWLALLVTGSLAALVKITTAAPLFLCATVALIFFTARPRNHVPRQRYVGIILIHGVILVILLLWIAHTDHVKAANPIGQFLTSSNLSDWNYGTLDQRLSLFTWLTIGEHIADIYFPYPRSVILVKAALSALLLVVFAYCFKHSSTTRRWQIASLLTLFALPFFIFTNLHLQHTYYQSSNAIFLTLAIGLAFSGAMESSITSKQKNILKTILLGMLVFFTANSIWLFHAKSSYQNGHAELVRFIQESTTPDSVILITGRDWAPDIPYLSGRKALMFPGFSNEQADIAAANQLIASKTTVSAYLDCGNPIGEKIMRMYFKVSPEPGYSDGKCSVYLVQ